MDKPRAKVTLTLECTHANAPLLLAAHALLEGSIDDPNEWETDASAVLDALPTLILFLQSDAQDLIRGFDQFEPHSDWTAKERERVQAFLSLKL